METLINSILVLTAVLSFVFLYNYHKANKLTTRTWIFSISAIILIPFGLAWGVTSFYEYEPQAGWVGIFAFSGLGLVSLLLAFKSIFPSHKNKEKSGPIPKLGFKIAIVSILTLGILTLPLGLIIKKTAKTVSDKEHMTKLLSDNIMTDEALPLFIKKTLAYETIYGEYPDMMETRIMQSMFSGVEDEEMSKILGYMMPKKERIDLLENGADAVETWFNTNAAYPALELNPSVYLGRADAHAEDMARWIYKNFALPDMSEEVVEKFENGEFSNNIEDYLGTPPDHLKDTIIVPLAGIIRAQIDSVDIPVKVSLAEELAKTIPAEEMLANKESIKKMPSILDKLWLGPLLLIFCAFILVFIAKLNWFKYISWSILAFGIRLIPCAMAFGNPQSFIDSMIPKLAEKAPVPVLAIMELVVPKMIQPIGQSFNMWIYIFLSVGLLSLIYVYRVSILNVLKNAKK